jgi:hypothetical protein
MAGHDRELPAEIDWPMALGYYSGIGLALAFEMMEPPLALFIAAIPILNLLHRPRASWPTGLLSPLLHGMARPRGDDGASASELSTPDVPLERRPTIWQEARAMADRARTRREESRCRVAG